MTDEAIALLAARIGTRAACAASGVPQATWYRRHRLSPPPQRPVPVPHTERVQQSLAEHPVKRRGGDARRQYAEDLRAGLVKPAFSRLGKQRQLPQTRNPGVRVRRDGGLRRAERRQLAFDRRGEDGPRLCGH